MKNPPAHSDPSSRILPSTLVPWTPAMWVMRKLSRNQAASMVAGLPPRSLALSKEEQAPGAGSHLILPSFPCT